MLTYFAVIIQFFWNGPVPVLTEQKITQLLSLQEAVVLSPYVAFAVRMNPGIWEYVKVHSDDLSVKGITPSEYLKFKETLYDENWSAFFTDL